MATNESLKSAVIYARVSSIGDRQNTERQVKDLQHYADKNGYQVTNVFTEHISGAKKNKERTVLCDCLNYCFNNAVNTLLISELSRLGRNVYEVLENVKLCKEHHLNIFFQKENLSTFQEDGKENMFLPIIITVLGVCAEMERENIYYRLESGRKLYIEQGGVLGRKKGSTKSKEQLREQYAEVITMLKQAREMNEKGVKLPAMFTIRGIAKQCEVGVSTVQRVKKEFNL